MANSFKLGDRVKLRTLGSAGEILEGPDSKGRYLVLLGSMKSWVDAEKLKALKPLKPVLGPGKGQGKGAGKIGKQTVSASTLRLDLHGKTKEQAEPMLEELLDRALLTGASSLEIIHGLGTGVIKSCVWSWAKKHSHIKEIKLAEANPGTSICYL